VGSRFRLRNRIVYWNNPAYGSKPAAQGDEMMSLVLAIVFIGSGIILWEIAMRGMMKP